MLGKQIGVERDGPRPLNSKRRHGLFLDSTSDIRHLKIDSRVFKNSDRGHWHFLKSTGDVRLL